MKIYHVLDTGEMWTEAEIHKQFEMFAEDFEQNNFEEYLDEALNMGMYKVGGIEDVTDIINWLYEHEQATEDILNHYGENKLENLRYIDINNWIAEHDYLFEDFVNHFEKRGV